MDKDIVDIKYYQTESTESISVLKAIEKALNKIAEELDVVMNTYKMNSGG